MAQIFHWQQHFQKKFCIVTVIKVYSHNTKSTKMTVMVDFDPVRMAGQGITEVPLAGDASKENGLGQASNMSSQSKVSRGMQKAEELTSLPSFTALPLLRTKSM